MASARKKLDEKNLKIVRELVSLPPNKFCFDCGQRGPTYVNVTIGSFVCTKCSGLLRGLTPPHRVKSISMTTFTMDEVEMMGTRGNEYSRRVWLGLYDGKLGTDGTAWDEHAIHQLMLDKYERKRFYMEPNAADTAMATTAAVQHNNQINNKLCSDNTKQQQSTATTTIIRPPPMQHQNNNPNNIILRNGLSHANRSRTTSSSSASHHHPSNNGDFVADFDHADIFTNNNNNNNNAMANGNGHSHGNGTDIGFANFDNNPAFKNTSNTSSLDDFSIFDLQFSANWGPMLNETPIFPKVNLSNKASFPLLASSNNRSNNHTGVTPPPPPPPVAEDKYAALKDLDESLHNSTNPQATTIDWGGSTSSLYSSATSPLSSSYGSPTTAPHFNPFNTNGFAVNGTNGIHNHNDMWNMPQQQQPNLFEQLSQKQQPQPHKQSFFPPSGVSTAVMNGHVHNGQASLFGGVSTNGIASVSSANPFDRNGGFVALFPPLSSSSSVASNGMNGSMASSNGENNSTAWNCQNPFKLASNGGTNNPFL